MATDTEALKYRPLLRNPEQMTKVLEQLKKRGYAIERLDVFDETKAQENGLLDELHDIDPEVDGNVDQLRQELRLYQQESAKKRSWLEKIPVIGKPLNWAWKTVKAHPYLTTAAVVAGAGALAYYTGYGAILLARVQTWAAPMLEKVGGWVGVAGEKVAEATEAVGEAAGAATDKVGEVAEGAKEMLGKGTEAMPAPEPMPTKIPPIDDAKDFLDTFEKTTGG